VKKKTSETLQALAALAGMPVTVFEDLDAPGVAPGQVVELAVLGSTNPDWDPMDHPRNAKGHFVEKFKGVFLLGQNKKGTFTGGQGSKGKPIDYDLEPGDIAYNSPLGNVYIKHADGSWTQMTTTGKKEHLPAQSNLSYVLEKKIAKGSYKQFDEAPATEVHADTIEEAEAAKTTKVKVGDTLTPAQIDLLPEGSQVKATNYSQLTFKVNDKGELTGPGDFPVDPTILEGPTLAKVGGKDQTPEKSAVDIDQGPEPSGPPEAAQDAPEAAQDLPGFGENDEPDPTEGDADLVGKKIKSTGELANAPVGTTMKVIPQNGDPEETYRKQDDGQWYFLMPDGEPAHGAVGNTSEDFDALLSDSFGAADYIAQFDTVPASLGPAEDVITGIKAGDKVTGTKMLNELPEGVTVSVYDSYMGYTDEYTKTYWSNEWMSESGEILETADLLGDDKIVTVKDPVGETPDIDPSGMDEPVDVDLEDAVDSYLADIDPEKPEPLEDWEQELLGYQAPPEPEQSGLEVGDPAVTEADLESLPVGSELVSSVQGVNEQTIVGKLNDGTWLMKNPDPNVSAPQSFPSKDYAELAGIMGWKVKSIGGTAPETSETSTKDYQAKDVSESPAVPEVVPEGLKVGTIFKSTHENMQALPVGAAVSLKDDQTYTKTGPNVWQGSKTTVNMTDEQMEGFTFKVEELPEAEKPKAVPVPVEGKKNKLTAASEFDAPELGTPYEPIENAANLDDILSEAGFKHPVSGELFPLEAGDTLLQHKLTPQSFAVMGADGSKKFQVNKLGKKYKWSPHIPKSNYHIIATPTQTLGEVQADTLPDIKDYLKGNVFTHPESGLSVTIGENEVLMQHNFTPHSYLVMNKAQTEMLYKIDVKGKKQKAGTNLKPSNYFVAKEGKAPKGLLLPGVLPENFSLMSQGEVNDYLQSADIGDFVEIFPGGQYQQVTKTIDGWKNQDGVAWSDYQVTTAAAKAPSNGVTSDAGVPLNAQEFEDWASALPDGSMITIPDWDVDGSPLTWTKKGDTLQSSQGTMSAPSMVSLYNNATLSAAQKKAMTFTQPPKKITNDHGVPVYDVGALEDFLDGQPFGTQLAGDLGGGWEKQDDGEWYAPNGGLTAEALANSIVGSGSDYYKAGLKTTPPKTATNEHGFPAFGTNAEIQAALESAANGSKLTVPSGAVMTKMSSGQWVVTQLSNGNAATTSNASPYDSKDLAEVISGWSEDSKGKIKFNAVEQVKQKVAAAKKKPAAKLGVASKTFSSESDFMDYISPPDKYGSGTGNTLFEHIVGKIQDTEGYQFYYMYSQENPYGTGNASILIDKMAKPEVLEAIQDAIVNLEVAKKEKGLLTASAKAKTSKLIGKLHEWEKISLAAMALDAGELPDENKPDPNFTFGLLKTWPFDMSQAYQAVGVKTKEVSFAKTNENLGWDPFNGTDEQYTQWLKDNGHEDYALYLPASDKKSLALHFMNAPGKSMMSYYLTQYQNSIKKHKFQASASAALAKKNGAPFSPKDSKATEFPPQPTKESGASLLASKITPEAWTALKFALSEDFDIDLSQEPMPSWVPENGPLSFIPPNAAKAIAHVAQVQGNMNTNIQKNIAGYLLKSGIWFDDHLIYNSPKHGKIALSPGMEVYEYGKSIVFVPKDADKENGAYFEQIDSDGDWGQGYYYSHYFNGGGFTKVYTAPYKVTMADATKDGQGYNSKAWQDLEATEGFVEPKSEFSGNEWVTLKTLLKDHPIGASDLTDKAKTLMLEHPKWAEMVVYKDLKGHYRVAKIGEAKWADLVKTAKDDNGASLTFLADIENPTDSTEVNDAVKSWSQDQVISALQALGMPPTGEEDDYELQAGLKAKIIDFGSTPEEFNAPAANVGVSGTLKPITGFSLGGGQPKKYFADANGDKYMAKVSGAKKFRPDAEHAGTSIFGMFGFNVPPTTVREIDGEYMIVSKVLDVVGDLEGANVETMSDKQLASAMASHPMDWSISNHDTHGGNFLVLNDGETLINIDKGQAWKALGNDKLEVGWELPGNIGGVWYDKFYKAVKSKKISKERLDFVTQAVLKKARLISLKQDDDYRAQLDFAFQNRTSFPNGLSKDKFIDLAVARKQGTFDDFLKFYEGIYKSGGYKFEWKKEDFESTQLDGSDAHLDISPDFIDSVKTNGLYGKSLFFAGTEVEDAHAHLYTSKQSNGNDNIHADMKIQPDGDAKISQWLKAQGVSGTTMADQAVQKTPEAEATNGLPDTTNAYPHLVALAKTVSTHAGDGAYNQSTISTAKTAQATLADQVSLVQEMIANDPKFVAQGKAAPKFETGHQQQAWLAWAQDILPKFDLTLEAMEKGEKSPKWSQTEPVYTAPKGIDLSGKPQAVEVVDADGNFYTKYSDWNYIGPDGPITQTEYEALQAKSGAKTTSLKSEDAPKQESVQIAQKKTFKVTKGSAKTLVSGPNKAELENGYVLTLGSDATTSGSAYWVTSPDYPGIEVQYEDRSSNSAKANRGRLQWRIKDWDGSQDRVEKAFDMVREMGLSLDAADDKSMEMFYWRHMMGALKGRKGAYEGKEKDTLDHYNKGYSAGMSEEAELKLLKEAFAKSMGQKAVDSADWKPKFGNERATQDGFEGEVTGRPFWERPDTSIEDLKKWTGGKLPTRTFWGSGSSGDFDSMSRVLFSGVQLSNEEKARFNGSFGLGGSASSDRGHGSSRVIYLRQNQTLSGSGVVFEPHILKRTTNYAANSDTFGDIGTRDSSAPWNAEKQAKIKGGSNEVMIKYSMSAWDDIAVARVDASARKKLLEYYAKKGITEIRGIPVEERIVTSQAQMEATMKKVWDMATAAEKAGVAK
jgi:hypothetical protein